MNYFITLYVLKNKSKKRYYLLYGFIIDTDSIITANWKQTKVSDKLKLYKLTYIVNSKNYTDFINNFNKITICDCLLDGEFFKRSIVKSGITYLYEKNKPTNNLSNLTEIWNINKDHLIENIKNIYSNKKDINKSIKDLLKILKEKTAIDFKKDAHRFGNLEIYEENKYNDLINFKFNKDNTSITVYLDEPLDNDIYIKIHSNNNKRCILNKLKILKKGETELNFNLTEESFHIMIEVWDEFGDIIFFNNNYYISNLSNNINYIGTPYKVRDEWSKNIEKSTNHNLNEIETVQPIKSTANSIIGLNHKTDLIYKTIVESEGLFNNYIEKQTKGKFIVKQDDRKGEINSYKIIKDLIDSNSNDSVLIIDPYFSVKSIGKLLGRIENKNIDIEIITSLTNIDSDTGKENKNNIEECKEFILKNKNILHKNLKITNILSGKNEAFHDRYLIRKLNTGEMDGYVLSNSINSMAQKYPFLVSPIESKIVKDILIYIEKLIGNGSIEDDFYKNLTREVIYDGTKQKNKTYNSKPYILPSIITGSDDTIDALNLSIDKGYILNDKLTINEKKYKEIIEIILNNWKYNQVKVVKSIGELLYNSTLNKINIECDILNRLVDKGINKKEFIKTVKNVIEEIEDNVNISSYRIETIEQKIYLILNKKAKGNSNFLYNNTEYLFYGEYLTCLYDILFEYSFDEYLNLLKKIKSPMMFTNLIIYMNISHFNFEYYKILIYSEIPCTYEFAAFWLLEECLEHDKKLDVIIQEISKLQEKDILHQGCIILSKLIFIYRTQNKFSEDEIYLFIKNFSNIFNNFGMNPDVKFEYLKLFKDYDLKNEFKFKVYMLSQIDSIDLKDLIIKDIIDKFFKYYKKPFSSSNENFSDSIINYFLKIISLDSEKYLNMFYDLSSFGKTYFEFKEPLLKEINNQRWYELNNIHIWESNILLHLKNAGYNVENYQFLLD